MQISDERLDDIVMRLQQGENPSTVSREEWLRLAMELKQLRLRTSSRSRTTAAPLSRTDGSH